MEVMAADKKWTDILKPPWKNDPMVMVLMAPRTAKVMTGVIAGTNGTARFLEQTDEAGNVTRSGLQITSPKLTAVKQAETFEKLGTPQVDPAYIGPLSGVPNYLLCSDRAPLIILRDAPWTPFLDVVSAIASHHKADEKHGGN